MLLAGLQPPTGEGAILGFEFLLSVFGYLLVPTLIGALAAWLWARLELRGSHSKEVLDELVQEKTLGPSE